MNPEQERGDEIIELGAGLFGLLSRPDEPSKTTCVVLLNAGFLPRSGPFRLHVRLARRLAAQGYAALRFDLPGVGDSVPHAARSQALIVRDVLDAVRLHTGYARFVVGGICSAASLGWKAALADSCVVGVILIDLMTRPTFSYMLGRLHRALRAPLSTWPSKLRQMLFRDSGGALSNIGELLNEWGARSAERSELKALFDRGVELFFLYTGGASYFLHPGQFVEMFGAAARSDNVQFLHWPHCDHMFYDPAERDDLIAATGNWLERRLLD